MSAANLFPESARRRCDLSALSIASGRAAQTWRQSALASLRTTRSFVVGGFIIADNIPSFGMAELIAESLNLVARVAGNDDA
jgi:hypothetical protein